MHHLSNCTDIMQGIRYLNKNVSSLSAKLLRENQVLEILDFYESTNLNSLPKSEAVKFKNRIGFVREHLEATKKGIEADLASLTSIDLADKLVRTKSLQHCADSIELRWMPYMREQDLRVYHASHQLVPAARQ